jgi:hypothetical protein
VALLPAGGRLDGVEAGVEATRRHELAVHRAFARGHRVLAADLDGVEAELLGELVERGLEREARLHRAVTALGAAAGLVRVHPLALEAVRADV